MIYRPMHYAELTVPLFGATAAKQEQMRDDGAIDVPIRVHTASLTRNDHNHADELKLSVEYRDAGVDPRQLTSSRVRYWAGNAAEDGSWAPTRDNLRFVGIQSHSGRAADEGTGLTVSLDFIDYTSFFLRQKNFPAEGIPSLSDTLEDAWRKICDHVGYFDVASQKIVSSVADLRDSIRLEDVSPATTLGDGAAARFRKLGKVQIKPGCDAWGVWSHCCGMLGLITFMFLDEVIVTTATDLYTVGDPPVFTLGPGGNINGWAESTDTNREHKGIGLTSFDPLTNTTLEAFYPLPGDSRLVAKRPQGKKKRSAPTTIQSENYEFFSDPGITDQDALERKAQRVFEEYSRQTLEGQFKTGELELQTLAKRRFETLALQAGDAIRVEVDNADRLALAERPSVQERIDYLVGARSYTPQIAELIAKNFDSMKGLSQTFHVRTLGWHLETSPDGGTCEITIIFVNLIDVLGSTEE